MIANNFHSGRHGRGQRGQAALIAVIGLLVLAIGMYTSYNLTRTVYEKIRLQNAADAAAYSMATLEARTFNFISFVNRAQVANYVQMMEAQSLLSSASFVEGYVGWAGDMSQAVSKTLKIIYVTSVPLLGPAALWIDIMSQTLDTLGTALEQTALPLATAQVDIMEQSTPRYIRLMTSKNQALFGVAVMMWMATTVQLAEGMSDIVLANDPNARMHAGSYLLQGLNVASYMAAFDFASWSPGGNSEADKRVRRVMTEMANASRYGSSSGGGFGPDFIISREPFEMLGGILGAMSGVGNRGAGPVKRLIDPIVAPILAPRFVGTTKMISEADGGASIADTGRHAQDRSLLSTGDAIVAKDQARAFRSWGDFASVVSGVREGRHCRYEKPSSYGQLTRIPMLLQGRDFKCDDDAHNERHRWRALLGNGGIQPYLKFAAHREGISADARSFNQPDVWVMLNKEPDAMAFGGGEELRFDLRNKRESARFDARIGQDGVLGSGVLRGINVLARAQVYYHRPGAWREPPNFFNPFWGARLAPKGVVIDRILSEIGLSGTVSDFISDNVMMH